MAEVLDGSRPLPLLVGQVVHASREAVRTPASLLVSLVLPVLFLVMSGLVVGASPLPDGAADPAIQRLVPGAAVFAVAMAAFVMLAFGVAVTAEQGVLKRLRAPRCRCGPTSPAAPARPPGSRCSGPR